MADNQRYYDARNNFPNIVHRQVQTADGKTVAVPVEVLGRFRENLRGIGNNNPIDLPEVTSAALEHMVEYALKHNAHERGTDSEPDIAAWDARFIRGVNNAIISELLTATRYVDMVDLKRLTVREVARKARGLNKEEMSKLFD